MKSFYCPHRTTVPILSAIGGKPLYIVYDTNEPSTYVVKSVGLLLVWPKEEEEVELRVCDRPPAFPMSSKDFPAQIMGGKSRNSEQNKNNGSDRRNHSERFPSSLALSSISGSTHCQHHSLLFSAIPPFRRHRKGWQNVVPVNGGWSGKIREQWKGGKIFCYSWFNYFYLKAHFFYLFANLLLFSYFYGDSFSHIDRAFGYSTSVLVSPDRATIFRLRWWCRSQWYVHETVIHWTDWWQKRRQQAAEEEPGEEWTTMTSSMRVRNGMVGIELNQSVKWIKFLCLQWNRLAQLIIDAIMRGRLHFRVD